MLKTTLPRLLLVPVLAFGCVFTSRPQLPAVDASMTVEDAPTYLPDASFSDSPSPPIDIDRGGDVVFVDTGIPSPATDAASDAPVAASDAGGGETDFCRAATRSADASADAPDDASVDAPDDAGYFNSRGQPCDPATFDAGRDAGDASDVDDAASDGADAASDAAETSSGATPTDAESRG